MESEKRKNKEGEDGSEGGESLRYCTQSTGRKALICGFRCERNSKSCPIFWRAASARDLRYVRLAQETAKAIRLITQSGRQGRDFQTEERNGFAEIMFLCQKKEFKYFYPDLMKKSLDCFPQVEFPARKIIFSTTLAAGRYRNDIGMTQENLSRFMGINPAKKIPG